MSHARLSDLGILNIERSRFSEIDKRKVMRREKRAKLRSYSHEEIKVDVFQ